MTEYDISFIGLGKLGLPLATNFAKAGFKVLAIDRNQELVNKLRSNILPWEESGLKQNLELSKDNIFYTDSYDEIVNSRRTIILVNTPSKSKDGSFSNEYVIDALTKTLNKLKEANKSDHSVIISSTVMPGSFRKEFFPIVDSVLQSHDRKFDIKLSYIPDFVALGNVIKDFEAPDFLMIGAKNKESFDDSLEIYKKIVKNDPPICEVSIEEAELAKVSLNAFITTKISFANSVGLIAQKLDKSIDSAKVTAVIGLDKRIGQKYFKPGGPYGGTCFPRDTWAFKKLFDDNGLNASQMLANEEINNMVDENIIHKIKSSNTNRVGILGLSFKEGTSVVTESIASRILGKFNGDKNRSFYLYDNEETTVNFKLQSFNLNLNFMNSIEDVVNNTDIVLLTKNYDLTNLATKNIEIIDPWGFLRK